MTLPAEIKTDALSRIVEEPLNPASLSAMQIAAISKLFALGNLTPLLHSTQRRMGEQWDASDNDEFIAFASRQLGKSWWGLAEAIETCIREPGSRVLYYAPTKDKLRDIVNDNMSPMEFWAPKGLIKRQKSADRWLIGESELRLCVLERAHVDRNRGINAKGLIVLEESCFVPSDDFRYAWESIIDAQRLRHKPRVLIITTPSIDENHFIHTLLLPRLAAKGAVAQFTIYDNPFLTLEDIEEIRKRVTEDTWRREYMAEVFRSKESVAIPEFDSRHIAKLSPPQYSHQLIGIDFGGSLDPHGIALCYYDYHLKKFCIYRGKLIPVNTSISDINAAAIEIEEGRPKGDLLRIVDCSGQISIELFNQGFSHIKPEKGPGSFEGHLQALRVAFQNDEILVDEAFQEMVGQLKHGKLNKQRTDFERAGGHHCDLIAAVMYAYKFKNESNPFPAHIYGSPDTHHMQHAPKQANLSSSLNSLQGRFNV